MALTLYGHPRSRTFRVLWVLAETGLPCEFVQIPAAEAAQDERITRRNPIGKIPVLQDGERVLTESMVIGYYLARKAGSPLLPADLMGECQVLQWTSWVGAEVERPLTLLYQHRVLFPPERRRPELADAAEPELKRPFDALERALADRPWLLGSEFTLADLHVAVVMVMTRFLRMDLAPWPRVRDWLDRCTARPAFAAAERLRA